MLKPSPREIIPFLFPQDNNNNKYKFFLLTSLIFASNNRDLTPQSIIWNNAWYHCSRIVPIFDFTWNQRCWRNLCTPIVPASQFQRCKYFFQSQSFQFWDHRKKSLQTIFRGWCLKVSMASILFVCPMFLIWRFWKSEEFVLGFMFFVKLEMNKE